MPAIFSTYPEEFWSTRLMWVGCFQNFTNMYFQSRKANDPMGFSIYLGEQLIMLRFE